MELFSIDPGLLLALGLIVLLGLLGAAAERYGADSRSLEPADSPPFGTIEHHS